MPQPAEVPSPKKMTDHHRHGGVEYIVEPVGDAHPPHHYAHGYSKSAWIFGGCVVLFVIIILVTIGFWIWAGTTTTATSARIHALDARLQQQRHSDFESEGLYSLGHTLHTRSPHVLQLCHLALYSSTENDPKALHRVVDQATAAAEHRNDEYYVVKAQFAMQFNVRPEELGYDTRRLGLDQLDEHYQLVHYELSSNFQDFSTVKLLETELDLHKKVLRTRREFVACSNNPSLSVKRCDIKDGLFVLNNTRLVLMDAPVPQTPSPTSPTTGAKTVPGRVVPKATAAPTARDDGVDLTPEAQESVKDLRRELTHLRLYYVQFYRSLPAVSRDEDTFREQLVLRVQPNKC